eukprot:Hpha_TRINITY_DN22747_c0_g1::TRINITY_DN22747_c0_g1_i1::g.34296::m.34296/K01192/E3.2.1.25, MANBA, manB; beta-mannosidase
MRLLPLIAAAAAAAGDTQFVLLSGDDWRLAETAGSGGKVVDGARVPGGVWDNLQRAGKVGDPKYRDNDLVFINSTTGVSGGWTFTKQFDTPAAAAAAALVLLEFDGLQARANVSLNGVSLLATDNMFRRYSAALPPGLLRSRGTVNTLTVQLARVPPPQPNNGANPEMLRTRDEADAWGWDWSPSLNPMAVTGDVRLVVVPNGVFVAGFSPKIEAVGVDPVSKLPTAFVVNASLDVLLSPASTATGGASSVTGTLVVKGDWGGNVTVPVALTRPAGVVSSPGRAAVHAVLPARVGTDVELWWPLHYGSPHLHTVTATVTWDHGTAAVATSTTLVKRVGFRSVGLYTGDVAAPAPPIPDPSHAAEYVGCFRDGNIYWGCAPGYSRTCQNALPHVAAKGDSNMTVARCVALCRAVAAAEGGSSTITLAGVQDGTNCFCGSSIGVQCEGCFTAVGTRADETECGTPCAGDPTVACGGASYMWGANSVYNISKTVHRPNAASAQSARRASGKGSGDAGFAVVVNGVKVFSRGANLVPFELLEATVNVSYIQETVKSTRDGGMNMLRVWGGGMYQTDVFYDECDRQGILIFHDAMFCQRLYPDDDAFADNVRHELRYQVHRLRHHPSIVLWDSSNENEGQPGFFYATVLSEIALHDDTRPLWPASPSSGFASGVHTDTGLPNGAPLVGRFAGSQALLDTHMPYNYCTANFVASKQRNQSTFFKSEFGQVSLPAFETLVPVLDEAKGDFGVFSPIMLHRKHAGKDVSGPITSLFNVSDFSNTTAPAFQRMIFLSQLAQALCIKTTLEELRRGVHTFGGLIWQLNDVWQASSWGSLDYGGRWRPLHHCLQGVLAPSVVSVWQDGSTLRIYGSHHAAPAAGDAPSTRVEINVTAIATGAARWSRVVNGIDHSGSAVVEELMNVSIQGIDPATEVVTTRILSAENGTEVGVSETVHVLMGELFRMAWVNVAASDVALRVVSVDAAAGTADVAVHNAAPAAVFYAVVTSALPGRFSRNLFFLPAGGSRNIRFRFAESASSPAALQASLRLEWLNKA